MNKRIFLICIYFICGVITAQTWETQNSGVKCTLNSVCFVDSLNGYVVGDSSTILKTIDGGKNWLKQTSPIKGKSLTKVQFISKTVGFIVSGSDGLFMSTKDGGITWSSSYIMRDSTCFFYGDFCFINENEGWMPARKEGHNYGIGWILHTINGGKTWEKQLDTFTKIQGQTKYFSSIRFFDNKIGWAIASDYFDNFSPTLVYKTVNGGLEWGIVGIIQAFPEIKVEVISKDTLWVGGSHLCTSFNGGYNWNYFVNELNKAKVLSPVSGLMGWVYYSNLFTKERKILFTKDAGKTWREDLHWIGLYIITGMANRNGYLWIVGTEGTIKKRHPNITAINNEIDELPLEFKLYPNYPNPFNPTTTISYQLPKRSFVRLTVSDLLGREVEVLVNSEQEAGYYQSNFDASKLASGTYMYTIRVNDFVKTQKMMVVK